MVTYFEKQRDRTVKTPHNRRRISMPAMMSFTRRPWEHLPRRKSSCSTDHSRRSSTSTRSNSTACDLTEECTSETSHATSERSGTSTVVSDGRRRSVNPDYDWEHDSIADLKAGLKKLDLSPKTTDSLLKGDDAANVVHVVDPSAIEENKPFSNGMPGVHEIDFVDRSAPRPRTAEHEPRAQPAKVKSLIRNEIVEHAEASTSTISKASTDEGETVTESAVAESKASEATDSSNQFSEAKIPARTSSSSASRKAGHLSVKTSLGEKGRKSIDSTSPSSPSSPSSPKSPTNPSPKSKSRPKLAVDLPGIPESDAETQGRHRRPSLSMIQQPPPSRHQATLHHLNRPSSSRPPVSMHRCSVRSISAPLPGQEQHPLGPPREMMQLVSQRQGKFNDMREERLRRLSNISNAAGASRPGSLMGRRHASAPVSDAAAAASSPRKRLRRLSGPVRPSFVQRMSFSRRRRGSTGQPRQTMSQAVKGFIRSPRKRPSWLMLRTGSRTG
ncbi:hypothetical protein DHEL01_v209672 [Diaporthe helianthi]|uniref:Uncharacterized protein n=1 Tax=Diaporthe helianthi TaxID=158607 RepID=A0A2P5HNV2_DIAHE|nr:hypothetical protein DHEL01_v209672 [Diaporthe helianthi]